MEQEPLYLAGGRNSIRQEEQMRLLTEIKNALDDCQSLLKAVNGMIGKLEVASEYMCLKDRFPLAQRDGKSWMILLGRLTDLTTCIEFDTTDKTTFMLRNLKSLICETQNYVFGML